MFERLKQFFARKKSDYELLLEKEADPDFVPPHRMEMLPDGTLHCVPYIKQPKPARW